MATNFPCLKRGEAHVPFAVLGHFPAYIGIARKLGAQFFYIPDNKLAGMTEKDLWSQNKLFLRTILDENGHFLLSTDNKNIRNQSWLARELAYLERHSARFLAIESASKDLSFPR